MLEGRVHAVAEGRNGRLFITDYGAPDADEILKETPFGPHLAALWRAMLARYAGFLAERSIPLVVLLAPDAFTACAQDLPEGWPRPGPVGADFVEATAGIENLTVVYPLAALHEARGGLPIYKKGDTHWPAYGAFVAYRALAAALPERLDVRRVAPREVSFGWREVYGDLGVNVDRKEAIPVPEVEGEPPQKVSLAMGPQRRAFQVLRNRRLESRALILRDSFATEMAPYLNASFGEIWMFGPAHLLDAAMVDAARPDVVIIQLSERRLLRQRPEAEDLGWRELFQTDMKSPAGKILARLSDAMERKAHDEATALAADVAAAEGAQAPHLIFAALACLRAERFDKAGAYARAALRLDRTYASAWRLLARALLVVGEPNEAAWSRAILKAVKLAPQNALYRQEYAYGLGRFGRTDQAIAELETAVAAFPDGANLRVLFARALSKTGQPERAADELERARALLPPGGGLDLVAARLRAGGRWRE